jgi:tetratricopeptide (TPR) repeat protein
MKPAEKRSIKKKAPAKEQNRFFYLFFLAGIIILTFFLYRNSLTNEILHFDDTEYFSTHPEITHLSWQGIKTFFSSYYLIMYQPLPVLTFSLNYYFTGAEPFPMHLVNLLFHLANIILVFHFARLLLNNKNTALIIALLFAIHPMNVEAVSWISARSSGMYTMFYILSLIYYIRYITRGYKPGHFACTLLFFILSLFSKSQAVTLPLVLLLIDYYYHRKLLSKKVIFEKIPFFLLSAGFAWITITNSAAKEIMAKGMLISYSPPDDFFMVCWSFVFYLVKFLVPVNLCAAYVYPPKTGSMLPLLYYFSPLVLAAAGYFLYRLRRNRLVMFGALLFLLTILINIQIIPSRLVIVADRYAYVPYLGLLLILVPLAGHLVNKWPQLWRKYRMAGLSLFVLYILFFSVSVVLRNKIWNNDHVFMSDMIGKNPEVPYLYRAYGTRGNWLKNQGRFGEALQDYSKAIKLKPDNAVIYVNRASLYFQQQAYPEVISDADQAIRLNYRTAPIFQIRAISKFYEGDYKGALTDCDESLKLDSTWPDAAKIRAIILDSIHKQAGNK